MRFALVCDSPRDSDVERCARELSACGQVVVVAPSTAGRSDDVVDQVRYLDVEVASLVADARAQWRRSAPQHGLPLLRPVPPEQDLLWRRDVASRSRGAHGIRQRLVRDWYRGRRLLGRVGVRQRRRMQRLLTKVPRGWRHELPEVLDLDLALGPVIDLMEPDVVVAWGVGALPTVAWAHERGGQMQTVAVVSRNLTRAERDLVRHFRHIPVVSQKELVTRWPSAESEPWQIQRRHCLGIGVTNSAGQGWQWARAAGNADADLATEVWALQNPTFNYPADLRIGRRVYSHDVSWGLARREHAMQTWSHALIESGRPLFGSMNGGDPRPDIAALQSAGVHVGLVFHGSDIRDPARHGQTHRFSPFTDPTRDPVPALQAACDRNRQLVDEMGLPVFVSTPDLLDYVPQATWLPVVVDVDRLELVDKPARARPLVVHAPSNPWLKGTAEIEQALEPLQDVIDYRRVADLAPEEAIAVIRQADVVIDQVLLGLYGVLACEALATGAVVLGHVGDRLRSHVPGEIPIIETTPIDLTQRMTEVLDQLPALRDDAAQRRQYVVDFHDGRRSAAVLHDFLYSSPELRRRGLEP